MSFDLERMEEALEGDSILLPRGLSREETREFILNSSKLLKANIDSMEFIPFPREDPLVGEIEAFQEAIYKSMSCENTGAPEEEGNGNSS